MHIHSRFPRRIPHQDCVDLTCIPKPQSLSYFPNSYNFHRHVEIGMSSEQKGFFVLFVRSLSRSLKSYAILGRRLLCPSSHSKNATLLSFVSSHFDRELPIPERNLLLNDAGFSELCASIGDCRYRRLVPQWIASLCVLCEVTFGCD